MWVHLLDLESVVAMQFTHVAGHFGTKGTKGLWYSKVLPHRSYITLKNAVKYCGFHNNRGFYMLWVGKRSTYYKIILRFTKMYVIVYKMSYAIAENYSSNVMAPPSNQNKLSVSSQTGIQYYFVSALSCLIIQITLM